MIKLKDLLTEQGRTWNTVAPTIPTKYPTTFLKLKHSIKSAQALSQFSEEGKQKVGDEFNKFVEQNGKNRVARRGKIKAALISYLQKKLHLHLEIQLMKHLQLIVNKYLEKT